MLWLAWLLRGNVAVLVFVGLDLDPGLILLMIVEILIYALDVMFDANRIVAVCFRLITLVYLVLHNRRLWSISI